jgi:hypothetical protein
MGMEFTFRRREKSEVGAQTADQAALIVRRRLIGNAFDNRDELYESASGLYEETIDLQPVSGIVALHDSERFEFNAVLLEAGDTAQNPINGFLFHLQTNDRPALPVL